MIQEEFSRLLYLYHEMAQGKPISVVEISEKTLQFIEDLKQVVIQGNAEDRLAAIKMLKELEEGMKSLRESILASSSLSEEEILAKIDNPTQYSFAEWSKLEAIKEKMHEATLELITLLRHPASSQEKQSSPEQLTSKKEGMGKKKRPKKSKWLRS